MYMRCARVNITVITKGTLDMKKISAFCAAHGVSAIWWIGCAMTVLVTVLRVVAAPLSRDPNTGRFSMSFAIIAVALLAVAAMALIARMGEDRRVDVGHFTATPLALATLLAGGLIGVTGVFDLVGWFTAGRVPPPQTAITSAVPVALLVITGVLAIIGGIVLLMLGRQILGGRGTREGMCTWEMLVPVLWVWFRLTRYLMSYASAVSLDECVYDFGMFVAELLFMFRFARFISGVGKTTVGGMMAYAMSASVWSLSAALTRVCMYALGDTQAYLASQLAGFSDFAVGLLALVLAGGLWYSSYHSDSSSHSTHESFSSHDEDDMDDGLPPLILSSEDM